jgi:5-methylcytosine-specific restriction enzyme subunit McrC
MDTNNGIFDNEFNRIIKYVTTLLFNVTSSQDSKKNLREILFILDEVSDERATAEKCSRISFNPMFGEFETVRDYCQLFLTNSISFDYKNHLKLFAFLLPMEYVFEDFLFGFIEKHLINIPGVQKLKSQKSDLFLARLYENQNLIRDKVFNLQHDIYFEYHEKKIIADAKYKITYTDAKNQESQGYKHGVSQNDLYQVISYGIRRNATDIFLIYPQTLDAQRCDIDNRQIQFKVLDTLADKDLNINIAKIPIIHNSFPDIDATKNLQQNFTETEKNLFNSLSNLLIQIIK